MTQQDKQEGNGSEFAASWRRGEKFPLLIFFDGLWTQKKEKNREKWEKEKDFGACQLSAWSPRSLTLHHTKRRNWNVKRKETESILSNRLGLPLSVLSHYISAERHAHRHRHRVHWLNTHTHLRARTHTHISERRERVAAPRASAIGGEERRKKRRSHLTSQKKQRGQKKKKKD